MNPRSSIRIGTTARALAAALAIGGAILSLSATPVEARDNGVRCATLDASGHYEFHMPGYTYYSNGFRNTCNEYGEFTSTPGTRERNLGPGGRFRPGRF